MRSELEPDGDLVFVVEDDGEGIPGEVLPRLFDPFSRANSAVARNEEGTGLGLPLCKRLTELLGGEIDVRTSSGDGTCVTIRFPADAVEIGLASPKVVALH